MSDQIEVIDVIRKITSSVDDIKDIVREGDEYFFQFPKDTFWSVSHWIAQNKTEHYNLYLYPRFTGTLPELAHADFGDSGVEYVFFATAIGKPDKYEGEIISIYEHIKENYLGVKDIFKKVLGA
jgi:hypothetical protein